MQSALRRNSVCLSVLFFFFLFSKKSRKVLPKWCPNKWLKSYNFISAIFLFQISFKAIWLDYEQCNLNWTITRLPPSRSILVAAKSVLEHSTIRSYSCESERDSKHSKPNRFANLYKLTKPKTYLDLVHDNNLAKIVFGKNPFWYEIGIRYVRPATSTNRNIKEERNKKKMKSKIEKSKIRINSN